MTRITPLPRVAITDSELQALMAEGEALGVPDELFARIVARARDQAVPLMRALLMSHAQGSVDHKLKEIIRILLARFAKDKYFASLRSTKARDMGLTEKRIDEGCFAYEDDSKGFSEAEKCALRYADLMFLDANQLDKTFYDEMKKHWSEAQIMELGAFIAFHYGMQMFMRSLDAVSLLGTPEPETQSDRNYDCVCKAAMHAIARNVMNPDRSLRGGTATSGLSPGTKPFARLAEHLVLAGAQIDGAHRQAKLR